MTVTLSLQEQFPTDNFDPKQPHVELAESVEPSKVKYDICDGVGYKVDKSRVFLDSTALTCGNNPKLFPEERTVRFLTFQIILSGNASSEVFVNLVISHYVPRHHRSKVTVLATALQANSLQPIKEAVSFYFIVIARGTSIANIDNYPPRCVLVQDCFQESCQALSEGSETGTFDSCLL